MSPLLKKNSFDSSKCVSLLELTLKRIKILKSKKLVIVKQSRDDVARLLQKGQDANAVARVEYAFREENIAEAYDLLEQYCQLVIKRISTIKSQPECPSDVKEAIDSLIYAAPRCGDLQELQKLRDLVTVKYGPEYSAAALELRPECSVNQQIIQKLSSRPPNSDTRLKLLKEIAAEYKINFNYQQAVAASFKNEERSTQDKQKASLTPSSQVSKGAVATDADSAKRSTQDHQEPTNVAVHSAISSKTKNADLPKANQVSDVGQQPAIAGVPKPIPSKPKNTALPKANQASDVVQQSAVADLPKSAFDSVDHDGRHESYGGYKSHAAQNASPSTTHSSSPKQKKFAHTSKTPIVGFPTTAEKPQVVPVKQVSLNEEESGHAALSTMHRATPRKKDLTYASDIESHTDAIKQKSSSVYAPLEELKGQQSIAYPSPNFSDPYDEGKGFTSSSYKELVHTHRDASVLPSTVYVSRPESPVQMPNMSVRKSSERKSQLDKPKGQAMSTQEPYEVEAFPSKPRPHSVINYEIDGAGESLASKQYARAHKSYVNADMGGGEDAYKEDSGLNLRTSYGSNTPKVDPYVRARQAGKMDYRNVSSSYDKQVRRTPQAMDEEEDTSLHEYYDRELSKGTHYRQGSNVSSHEGTSFARERERGSKTAQSLQSQDWESRNSQSPQRRHQESSIPYHRNTSTLREGSKGYATRRPTRSELDLELADVEAAMESAARAADAAKVAIDMVRTSSMRSRASKKVGDVNDPQRGVYSRTIFKSSSRDLRRSTDGVVQGSDAIMDERERKHSTHAEMSRRVNAEVQAAPHQEQEPDLYDAEMPHFDDYSSYESSEEAESAFYTKGRAATTRKDGGTASHYQDRVSASYGYADNTAIRRGVVVPEVPTRDASKQRWKITADEEFKAEPPLQARMRASQHEQTPFPTQEAQAGVGKHYGVSRRSVRSSRLT